MGYEDAESTKLLATHCAACGRPLRDAESVEVGMGPICRDKLGLGADAGPGRGRANQIVHQAAAEVFLSEEAALELVSLGFPALAARLAERLADAGKVVVTDASESYLVRAPYLESALGAWRAVPGRRWDKAEKAQRVPKRSKRALWQLLKTHYRGAVLEHPNGTTVVGAPAPETPKATRGSAQMALELGARFSAIPDDCRRAS